MAAAIEGFVLTRGWRDTPSGLSLTFWLATAQGPLRASISNERAVMFVEREQEAQADARRQVELTAPWGVPVDALYFGQQRALERERERLRQEGAMTLEADVKPGARYLMERFVTGGCRLRGDLRKRRDHLELLNPKVESAEVAPSLTSLCLDIETDGIRGPVISVAFAGVGGEECLMARHPGQPTPAADSLRFVADERALLEAAFAEIRQRDPDILTGWNVVEFDLSHLMNRAKALGVRFSLGRGGERATILEARSASQLPIPRIPGRVVLDGITTLKSATFHFERFTLEHVAQELLGRGKEISATHDDKIAEIKRLWREDPAALASYNVEDCRLVQEIFEAADLVGFSVARQRMTGLSMSRAGGSVAAFDYLYLPRLHRRGRVAGEVAATQPQTQSPGGYVLASKPGLHRNVIVLDFKSLYPSIIRTFKIDPMGMAFPGDDPIEGFDGASFHREDHILPDLIAKLWARRDEAKKTANAPMSRAIKILMNSFYGVLGTPACRFFSPRLASSITRRGHEIITRSRDWLLADGREVIYGDTDSLFVRLDATLDAASCESLGSQLAERMNRWWSERLADEHRLESMLEMEYEICYRRFFMPTLRGSDEGSAKRYAGWVDRDGGTVIIKGLEAVRTDWTPLARRFQRELFRRVFRDEPFEDWIREIRQALLVGALDDELIYRKRLRRAPEEYVRNVPPHVKAARMLDRPVREVRYVITSRGPEPVERRSSPIDHRHYLERQLAPAADGILACLDTSFAAIAGDQLRLF
jgi:DNA polymerase II